jgi:hypothetical protein
MRGKRSIVTFKRSRLLQEETDFALTVWLTSAYRINSVKEQLKGFVATWQSGPFQVSGANLPGKPYRHPL